MATSGGPLKLRVLVAIIFTLMSVLLAMSGALLMLGLDAYVEHANGIFRLSEIRAIGWSLLLVVILIFLIFVWLIKIFVIDPLKQILKSIKAIESGKLVTFPLDAMRASEFQEIAMFLEKTSGRMIMLERDQKHLRKTSEIDGLTGLFNRRYLDAFLESSFSSAKRYHHEFHIIMVDIDYFKKLNDNYGHHIGDLCLKELGKLLAFFTRRSSELAARYGGEEFTLVVPGMGTPDVIEWANQIRTKVEELKVKIDDKGSTVSFTLSMGIASLQLTHASSVEEMMSQADRALYTCKENGRNQVQVFQGAN